MEKNFFIKEDYVAKTDIASIGYNKNIHWLTKKISESYYNQYFVYKICKEFIKQEKLESVLDIGCGTAIKLIELIYPVCHEIYGIDQELSIKYCRKKYGLNNFFIDDIENPNQNLKRKFDLIIVSDVIEHLLNPDKLICYLKRYCHKNTYIVISTPERDIIRDINCTYSPKSKHIREWNKQEFSNYLINRKFRMLIHINIQSFRILINFKNPFKKIFNDLLFLAEKINKLKYFKKIKHTQFVICKLFGSNEEADDLKMNFSLSWSFKIVNEILNKILFKLYRILFKLIRTIYTVSKFIT